MTAKAIKESLLHQLILKGADVDLFVGLVDEYVKFWELSKKYDKDIRQRGITYVEKSAAGVPMTKNNPSVKEKVAVNKQMLAILAQLKITTDMEAGECADDKL